MPFSIRRHTSLPGGHMTRKIIVLIGLVLLVGCSGGGGDEAPPSSPSANNPTPAKPTEFLIATPSGLWRGLPNGQGGIVFAQSNFVQQRISFSGSHVFYERLKGPNTGTPLDDTDIWTVKPDGTGHRAAVNTTDPEKLFSSAGPWMVYMKILFRNGGFDQEFWSLHETGAQHLLLEENMAVTVQVYSTDRVLFMTDRIISSNSLTGTDHVIHAEIPHTDRDTFMARMRAVGNHLIFIQEFGAGGAGFRILTVPLAGGTSTPLESDQFNSYVVGTLGSRVVYHRCAPAALCDVASIEADGTNRVVLASHPANEAVQGVTTSQVIIRRNLAGNDQLVAVPVAGGPEKPLMTMTDNEFVETMVGDTIIIRRPTGTWTLDLNGNLKQIGTKPGLDFFRVVGDSICSDFGEIWCLPIDGSRAEVRIDRNGKFLGVL